MTRMTVAGEQRSVGAHPSRWVTLAALAAITMVWGCFSAAQLVGVHGDDPGFIDLLVYRAGGHAALTGNAIYGPDFASVNNSPHGLAFTYPPFAALIFVPLALLPAAAAKTAMVLLNAAACAIFFAVLAAAMRNGWDRLRNWRSLTAPITPKTGIVLAVAATVFTFGVPVEDNFAYGQVNLILAAAVAFDILLPSGRWPRGIIVGVAVAVKLTPAVFLGYFLVTRQWRALVVSLVTAMSALLLSWLVIPEDTIRYFTSTLFDPARIGGLAFASNQSMRGVMERIPALDSVRGLLWVVATVLVVGLAIAAIEGSRRSGDIVAGMLSAAVIGLLCSPVSWGHHWVWLSAAAVYFLVLWATTNGARYLVAGVALAAVTLEAPWKFLPNSDQRELLWNPLQHLLGTAWAAAALLLLVYFAARGVVNPIRAERRNAGGDVHVLSARTS